MSNNNNHPIMEGTGANISGKNKITSPTPFTISTFTSRRKKVVEWKKELVMSEMYVELEGGLPCGNGQLAIQIWQWVKHIRYITTTSMPALHYPGVAPHNDCHGGVEDGHDIDPDEGVCAHTHTQGPLPSLPPLDEGLGEDLGDVIPLGQPGNPIVVN